MNLLNALKYTVPVHTSIRTMESLKMIRTFLYLYVDGWLDGMRYDSGKIVPLQQDKHVQSSPLVRSGFCPMKIDQKSGLTLYPGYY